MATGGTQKAVITHYAGLKCKIVFGWWVLYSPDLSTILWGGRPFAERKKFDIHVM